MPEPIERGRTSVWEYVNPLAVVDRPLSAYTSPFAAVIYGPYSALAAGRGIQVPGVFPVLSNVSAIGKASRGILSVFNQQAARLPTAFTSSPAGKLTTGAVRGLLFGFSLGGEATADARALASAGNTLQFGLGTNFERFRKARIDAVATTRGLRSAIRSGAGAGINVPLAEKTLAATRIPGKLTIGTVGRAGLIRLGSTVGGLMNAAAVIQIATFGAEAAFKGIQSVAEMIDRSTTRIHSLELGGELGRNFLTRQAATERQRALTAIQASHLSGRRMMGNEAGLIHQ